MEQFVYYIFCAMMLGGALGTILARGYVNAAMSMLLSMLGVAGMMVLMEAVSYTHLTLPTILLV